ncbi:hypothetical protein F8M41_024121 [Gigaspora margarita]|uniref:Uncharacterized protein n=1 Tax=Gigaspora margarita TaxID=4874 RepID=A0A8H4B0L3_GIGMA|nr:hypothetical protein F8M41_024121 [Gigaspora margarita]
MNNKNFGHLSRQYNSLFSFATLGYMGSEIHLPHSHAFIINGHSYYQIHSVNTKGNLVNWFVYDANAQDHIANQCRLDKNVVNLIEQELTIINQFVQSLY